jgi:hypothetical protein
MPPSPMAISRPPKPLAAARLQLARETLELHRENSYAQKEKKFSARLEEEKKKASQEYGCLTPEVLEKIEKELNLL